MRKCIFTAFRKIIPHQTASSTNSTGQIGWLHIENMNRFPAIAFHKTLLQIDQIHHYKMMYIELDRRKSRYYPLTQAQRSTIYKKNLMKLKCF